MENTLDKPLQQVIDQLANSYREDMMEVKITPSPLIDAECKKMAMIFLGLQFIYSVGGRVMDLTYPMEDLSPQLQVGDVGQGADPVEHVSLWVDQLFDAVRDSLGIPHEYLEEDENEGDEPEEVKDGEPTDDT